MENLKRKHDEEEMCESAKRIRISKEMKPPVFRRDKTDLRKKILLRETMKQVVREETSMECNG